MQKGSQQSLEQSNWRKMEYRVYMTIILKEEGVTGLRGDYAGIWEKLEGGAHMWKTHCTHVWNSQDK